MSRNWQCHFHYILLVSLKVQIQGDLEPCFKTSTVKLRMWTKSECIGTRIYLPTITENMETMDYGARVYRQDWKNNENAKLNCRKSWLQRGPISQAAGYVEAS